MVVRLKKSKKLAAVHAVQSDELLVKQLFARRQRNGPFSRFPRPFRQPPPLHLGRNQPGMLKIVFRPKPQKLRPQLGSQFVHKPIMTQQPNLIEIPRRPVLRWHGGKWMLAPWVISHFPEHKVYVEPYGGAASVLLRKPRSKCEIYNDMDKSLVNLFRVLRTPDAERLIDLLRLTPWSRTEFFDAYGETDDPVEWARRTVVRAFMGFGTTGMMKQGTGFRGKAERSNSTGPGDFVNYPNSLHVVINRLRGVTIENRPALDIIKREDSPETLFYCDPPYPHATRSALRSSADFSRCYAHEMHDADHRKLGDILRLVKGMVVISGYHCDLYDREIFADWTCVEKNTLADGGKKRVECLWLNPSAAEAFQR